MNGKEVVLGKEYVLDKDYEYWCIELQRLVKITSNLPIIVKINQTFQNRIFFGKLIDSQGELEFGPEAIIKEYKPEPETIITPLLLFGNVILEKGNK